MDVDLAPYDAVLFDWDGTVVDSQPLNYRCLREVLAPRGIVLDRDWYRERIGTSTDDLLVQLGVEDPVAEILDACRSLIAGRLSGLSVHAPVSAMLGRARAQGRMCAVASGGAGVIVRAAIGAVGLEGAFDVVVTREDVARGKPAPDLFLEAARRLGVTPGMCLVVEDAEEGLAAARAAGMEALDVSPWVTSTW
ncbi:HAD family phosphatase [Streptomyces sp. SID3343]|uniref:HAD family hydrolase n=1 Tax=Streptomyces sp. SID3343 TaxID=2690260 RepID=UPI0013708937|nr:HAD family phosphatase [Streptomyces sp. SID3343]MYV98378.1 HAD-IA family hydrolase [Streptomyces sp. SID3343]